MLTALTVLTAFVVAGFAEAGVVLLGVAFAVVVWVGVEIVLRLAGFAPALTIVVVVVEVAGVGLVVALPDEITLTVFAELVGALLLAKVNVPPPEPDEPPLELDANATTGAALLVGDVVDKTALAKLGAVVAGMTTWVILLAVVCGPMAVQGGPPGQPVITS